MCWDGPHVGLCARLTQIQQRCPAPGAKTLQNRLLGPLGACCAKTGTIETEEVVAFRPIAPQEAKPPGSWILAPGSLLTY
jgi:hypothetical protein